jgi:FMN phosphatase YigB (HAD superfamily)
VVASPDVEVRREPRAADARRVRAVVFDVGETLVDETRSWMEWADWLEVPAFTFLTVLGGLVALGLSHTEVFEIFSPGFDLEAERRARREAGRPEALTAADLYPDAIRCLDALKRQGYVVGAAANQPASAGAQLRGLPLELDVVITSADLGIEKPSIGFFHRVADAMRLLPEEIAYVGDRIDNDVIPSASAGMVSVWLKRGPWAYLRADEQRSHAAITVESLDHLPAALARARA